MPGTQIELDPADFVTVGTVGPKGRRLFHLQAASSSQVVTLIIEKEQARALSEAIDAMLAELGIRDTPESEPETPAVSPDMALRDPIEPLFRVAQLGLGYDEERDMVVLVAQELVPSDEDADDSETSEPVEEPSIVHIWASRTVIQALSRHAIHVVKQGRPDPKNNGHLTYYYT